MENSSRQWSTGSRRKVMLYALGNLCLHILLVAIIIQCVWLARMGVTTQAEAITHIFLPVPAYNALISSFQAHESWRFGVDLYVCPYVLCVLVVLIGNAIFSFKASRIVQREKSKLSIVNAR